MEKCILCEQIRESGSEVQDLASALLRLQRTIQPILESYDHQRKAHFRCALCTILVGESHTEQNLVLEPMVPRAKGQKRYAVCPNCHKHLKSLRMSVPQARKYHQRLDEILQKEEEIEEANLPTLEEAEAEARAWALESLTDNES